MTSKIRGLEKRIKQVVDNINLAEGAVIFGTIVPFGKKLPASVGRVYPALIVSEIRKVKAASGSPESSDRWILTLEATKPFELEDVFMEDDVEYPMTESALLDELNTAFDLFFTEFGEVNDDNLDNEWLITTEITYNFDLQSNTENNVSLFAQFEVKCYQ